MQSIEEVMPKMKKVLDNLSSDLASIHSGRVHPGILDSVKVLSYGQTMPLSSVSTINVADVKTLTITVWDHENVAAVDKAIQQSPLGVNPRVEGNILFVTFPPITEERRMSLIKLVKQKEEEAKVIIRNIRRDMNNHLKDMAKTQEISKDEESHSLKKVQEMTDTMIKNSALVSEKKQQELLTF